MNIAVLGATSQIGKDLIVSLEACKGNFLTLYSRRPEKLELWAKSNKLRNYKIKHLDIFTIEGQYDAVLNFIGSTSPSKVLDLGSEIDEITTKYDLLVLSYLKSHPNCKYIFISSGAVYGDNFESPVMESSKSVFPINNLQNYHWYGISKLNAEIRHRAMPKFSIVDIRIFNYFSHTQDMTSGFFMAEIAKAIKEGIVFKTSGESINRDYLNPEDFFRLISMLLKVKSLNIGLDCYSLEPINKKSLLQFLNLKYSFEYEITTETMGINAYGARRNYYSNSKRASKFGYIPIYTSLDGIEKEIDLYLQLQQ